MEEIFSNVLKAAKGAAQSLGDVALAKLPLAGALAFIVSNHGTALWSFVGLVLIDLLTKYLSLSALRLSEKNLPGGLFRSLLGIWKAFQDGYIKSELMKTKFAGKILLYMILVSSAVNIDVMAGGEGVFLRAAWYYLAATEGISIIENLRDAGVQSLDPLLAFIRSKLGGLK